MRTPPGYAASQRSRSAWLCSTFPIPKPWRWGAPWMAGRKIATIAAGGDGIRNQLLQLVQEGVHDVLQNFTYRQILHAANRAAASWSCAGELSALAR